MDPRLAGGEVEGVREVFPFIGPTKQLREKSPFVLPITLNTPTFPSYGLLESDCLPNVKL